MSLFTDVRDNVENSVGIGPDSNTSQTISDAVVGLGRQVGSTVSAPASKPVAPQPSSAPAALMQRVDAFAMGNQKMMLLLAVGLAAFLVFPRLLKGK